MKCLAFNVMRLKYIYSKIICHFPLLDEIYWVPSGEALIDSDAAEVYKFGQRQASPFTHTHQFALFFSLFYLKNYYSVFSFIEYDSVSPLLQCFIGVCLVLVRKWMTEVTEIRKISLWWKCGVQLKVSTSMYLVEGEIITTIFTSYVWIVEVKIWKKWLR